MVEGITNYNAFALKPTHCAKHEVKTKLKKNFSGNYIKLKIVETTKTASAAQQTKPYIHTFKYES